MSKRRRHLWLKPVDPSSPNNGLQGLEDDDEYINDTYDTVLERFSSRPEPKSLSFLLSNTLVVGQEFVLTCLLLAGHRETIREEDYHRSNHGPNKLDGIHSDRLLLSLGLVWLTLAVSVIQNRFATSKQYKIKHRLTDILLMAILLRFLSAVLKTLTASYSSDTVYSLSVVSLFLHLLTCDYAYANGYGGDDDDNDNGDGQQQQQQQQQQRDKAKEGDKDVAPPHMEGKHKRPTFKGGLVSLSSAFFATTLLASRLESNAAVYVFVCSSVVLFALFPAARHLVALKTRQEHKWGTYFYSLFDISGMNSCSNMVVGGKGLSTEIIPPSNITTLHTIYSLVLC
jgi:hypothetical protein